jgi:hypothetical protein
MPKAVVIPIAVMLLALGAATAHGASSRAEYVAQADPICQAGSAQEHAAFKSYVKSVKRYDKHHHGDPYRPSKKAIRLVVRHYSRVLAIERSMNSQLSSISAAPGDEAAVNKWLQLRSQAADLLERTTPCGTSPQGEAVDQALPQVTASNSPCAAPDQRLWVSVLLSDPRQTSDRASR